MTGTITIDNLGNVLQDGIPIGYYDEGKCYMLADDSEMICPALPQNFAPAVIKSKPTYWWVAFVAFGVLVIFIAWFINRK